MSSPVVIVTGASKGIGLAVAEILLANFHAKVVSLSRSKTTELEKLGQKYPSGLDIIQCDITDEIATTSAIASSHAKHGRLDGLILNAGVTTLGRITSPESTLDVWKQIFDINFFSLLTSVRAAIPHLRANNGKIIFVSSGAAEGGTASWAAYNASKAAMNSFNRTLANEEPDITCISVRPGVVDTDMQTNLRAQGGPHMKSGDYERFMDIHASGKLVKPADCGGVIAALALKATKDLSGRFISWDAEELRGYRQ